MTVPQNGTHHLLLFWTLGATNMNMQLDARRQRVRLDAWDGIHILPEQSSWWDNGPACVEGIFHIHLARSFIDEDPSVTPETATAGRGLAQAISNRHVIALAKMVLACAQSDPQPSKLLWDSYAVLLRHHLLRSAPAALAATHGQLAHWQVRRSTDFLNDHIGKNIGIAQLASLVGLSPFHFARAFKQSTGLPPHRYQLALRIARAKVLLEATNTPITQIAFDVGYESSQALARLFRREVGVSPTEFRRQRGGG